MLHAQSDLASPVHEVQHIGLATNTFAHEAFTADTVNARFTQARKAGINFIYLSPKWNELEPSPGHYNFKDLDFQMGRVVSSGFLAALNLRVIDTTQRTLPSDLMSKDLSDPIVEQRLLAMLDAITQRTKDHIQFFLVGNEVDKYFEHRTAEIPSYADLFAKGASRIKQDVPGAQVSFSTTFDGLAMRQDKLQAVAREADYLALTYYPVGREFQGRNPENVPIDFAQILAAAGENRIFLQEIGYPSGALNGSSEDQQAAIYAAVLDQLAKQPGRYLAANFLFMSDFSDEVVDGLAKYYQMAGADRFRSFLKTLGLFDDQGRPKKSWAVFQSQVPALTGCH